MSSHVVGVTSVDDELFVFLLRWDSQVAVYSINDYQLLRHVNLPALEPEMYNDITSCVRYKCIYTCMWDYHDFYTCIYRYDLASSAISYWPVPVKLRGLSVTPSCNLLVTCCGEPAKLVELSADNGRFVRDISLQSDIVDAWHSVQLGNGQFVVCQGGPSSGGLHRVCIVGDNGRVIRSYGNQSGCDAGQLNCPRHLAVDKDSQFVFVADYGNHRVVLLSPTLEFVRYFSEGKSYPQRLCFHQATRRLFVGRSGCRVTAIQL